MSRPHLLAIGATILVALAVFGSLFIGRADAPLSAIWDGLFSSRPSFAKLVVFELRLPRALLALLVGAALGLSGAVLQGLLRNPLADPGLLGVSGGAALGAVVAIYFGLSAAVPLATPALGLVGALGAGALTFTFGRGGTLTMILAGAAVSSLMGAFLALALNFAPSPYAAYEVTIWMLGSLTDRTWDHIALAGPFIVAGLALLAFTGRALDALALGETQAASLGVNLDRTRLLALLGAGLAVGAATSVTGAIGFIGLVAPHLVRGFVGHEPRRILLPSAMLGAALLLFADIATRLIHTNTELKLGVLTSLVGAPFFFALVVRLKKTSP